MEKQDVIHKEKPKTDASETITDLGSNAAKDMLTELCTDNRQLTLTLRSVHEVCERHNDVATASLIENWIDETERRTWFLSEIKSGL